MKAWLKWGVAALALGLVAGTSPVLAQTPAPEPAAQVSPEQVRLGVQFAEQMLGVMDINAILSKEMTGSFAGANGEIFQIEPKWRDFFLEAMSDEFRTDHVAIVTVLGRGFAKTFTADELKVGILVFRDPAMPVVMKALLAGQSPPTGLALQPATMQAITTPAGRSFGTKLTAAGPTLAGAKNDLIHILMPGFFQHFADKAVALERQRRLAEGLPPAG